MARRGNQRRQIDGKYEGRRDEGRVRRRRAEAADEPLEAMGEGGSPEGYQDSRRRSRPKRRAVEDGRHEPGDSEAARSDERRARGRSTREGAPEDVARQRSSRRRPEPQDDEDILSYFGKLAEYEVLEETSVPMWRRTGLASILGAAQQGAQRRERPQEAGQRKARPRPQEDERAGARAMRDAAAEGATTEGTTEQAVPTEYLALVDTVNEDLTEERTPRNERRTRVQGSQRSVRRDRAADGAGDRRLEADEDATSGRRRHKASQKSGAHEIAENESETLPSGDMQEEKPRGASATGRRPAAGDMGATGREEEPARPARATSAEGDETPRRRRRRPEAADDAAPARAKKRRVRRSEGDATEERTSQVPRARRRRDNDTDGTADGGRSGLAAIVGATPTDEDGTETKRRRRPHHAAADTTKLRRSKKNADVAAVEPIRDGRAPQERPSVAEPLPRMGSEYEDLDLDLTGLGQYDDLIGAYDQQSLAAQDRGPALQGWERGPYGDPYADPYADLYAYDDEGGERSGGRGRRGAGERRGGSRPTSLDWQRGLGHEGMTFEEDKRAVEAALTHRDARQLGMEESYGSMSDYDAGQRDWLPDFIEDYDAPYDSVSRQGRDAYMATSSGRYGRGAGSGGPSPQAPASSTDEASITQRPLWTPAPEVKRYASPAFKPTGQGAEGGRGDMGEDGWQEFAELIARGAFAETATQAGQASQERMVGLAGVSGPVGDTDRLTSHAAWDAAGVDEATDATANDGATGVARPTERPADAASVTDDAFEGEDLGDVDEFDNYDDYNPFDNGARDEGVPEEVDGIPAIDYVDHGGEVPSADAIEGEAVAEDDVEDIATYFTAREASRVPDGYMPYVPFVDDAPEDSLDDAEYAEDGTDGVDGVDDIGLWADTIIDDKPNTAETRGEDVEDVEPEVEDVEDVADDVSTRRRVRDFFFGARVRKPKVFETEDEFSDENPWLDEVQEKLPDGVDEVEDVEEVEEVDHSTYENVVIDGGAVLEDLGDEASTYVADPTDATDATDEVDAEEVPTEHVEVHLGPPTSDEASDTGGFASKWRVGWRGKREASHVADEQAPRGPKRRRPIFLICYLMLVVGLVVAGFFAYQYTYESIVRYERSRSSTFMDNLIDDLQAGGEAAARRKDQIIESLELGAHDSRDLLSARLDRGVGRPGYRLEQQGTAVNATEPVYTLYVDESPYLMLELHAVDSYVRFGILAITDWEIADAYVFEAGAKIESVEPLGQGQAMEVSVPDGAIAYVNGTALTGEDLSDPPNILAGFVYASRFVNVPEAITYRVEGLHTAPEVWATDAAGNPVELSHSGNIYRATSLMVPNATPDDLPVNVLTLTETWSRFLTGDLGGADVNYGLGQVTSFLVPGSALYEQAVAYARGNEISFIMKHYLDSFSDESVNNCVRYNEDLFSCDVHFKKNMTLNATRSLRSDVFDNSLIFAYVDELGTVSQPGWYLVDMQPTGEVA